MTAMYEGDVVAQRKGMKWAMGVRRTGRGSRGGEAGDGSWSRTEVRSQKTEWRDLLEETAVCEDKEPGDRARTSFQESCLAPQGWNRRSNRGNRQELDCEGLSIGDEGVWISSWKVCLKPEINHPTRKTTTKRRWEVELSQMSKHQSVLNGSEPSIQGKLTNRWGNSFMLRHPKTRTRRG